MSNSIYDKLKYSIQAAEEIYHRLVLLVGESGSGKTYTLQEIAKKFDTSIINVNLALSDELLELTPKQRQLQVHKILNQLVEGTSSPVILDNLEILFDKDLQQDPLRLLQSVSRNQTVLASWNGSINFGKLVYAEISHPEYRSYESVNTLIVSMDGTATIDSAQNN